MALQVPDGNNIFAARVCYNYAIQADGTTACANPGAAGHLLCGLVSPFKI
ncbi:TPA: hypothetical protein ACPSKE_000609 [Legionella feeleii]